MELMSRPNRTLWMLLTGLAALLLALPARAEDPPARAGRVADVSGLAWIFDAESRDWERLTRNQTIAEGDRLRSDSGARITLRIGSTTLWLDERSELEFERLDDERVLLRVERGGLALRLRSREQAQDYRLLTREGRFFPDGEGMFRVDQLERGSRLVAWQGRARFEFRAADAEPVWLNAGEQAEVWWSQGPRTERQPIERDGFARWLHKEREAEGEVQAYRYVSPEMTGAEDLDRYGRWDSHVDYGAIWFPSQVAIDWAPYRHGRWAWTVRWGWTWVDEQPWGFAPFHYGRWVMVGGRWCWAPGRYVARPVYAPALVAWTGGPQVSVGISIGGRRPPPPRPGAWVPLAPREVYQPHYRHTPSYRERINREHDPVTVTRPGERPQRPQPPRPREEPGRGHDNRLLPQPPQQTPLQPQPPQVVPRPMPQPPQAVPQPMPQRPQPPQPPSEPETPRPPRLDAGVPMSAQERAWQQRGDDAERRVEPPPLRQLTPAVPPPAPMPMPERRFERGPDRAQDRGPDRNLDRAEPARRFERSEGPVGVMPVPRPPERQIERPMERPPERAPERAMPAPVRPPQPAPERARPAPAEERQQDNKGVPRSRAEAARGEQAR